MFLCVKTYVTAFTKIFIEHYIEAMYWIFNGVFYSIFMGPKHNRTLEPFVFRDTRTHYDPRTQQMQQIFSATTTKTICTTQHLQNTLTPITITTTFLQKKTATTTHYYQQQPLQYL